MKRLIYPLIALATIFPALRVVGESDPLFPFIEGGKVGFLDSKGETRIQPSFGIRAFDETRRSFQEGLQAVQIGDLIGYINRQGQTVVEPRFEQALPFKAGLAPVRDQNGKWGFISTNGTFVIEPQFQEAEQFSDGLAQVTMDHKMGYIDRKGHFVVEPQYTTRSHFSNFKEGYACVCVSNLWGFISTNGAFMIPPRFNRPSEFSGGLAPVEEGERFSHNGYIDKKGQYAISARFFTAWGFSEGLARVQTDTGRMQFITPTGETAFEVDQGAWAGEFSGDIVNVCCGKRMADGKWGYMDKTGQWIIAPTLQQAEPFQNGIAAVVSNGQRAYINKAGKTIWTQKRQQSGPAYPPQGVGSADP